MGGCSVPTDIGEDKVKNPFFTKPLLKLDNDYILVDKNYCAWNFYEIILNLLKHKYIDIGTNIENLLKKQFIKNGFKIHSGKYENSDRECDLVIEEDESIIFIEIKKKSITRKSISGNDVKIVMDVIDMFIHSQGQILEHDKFLTAHTKIQFKNGTILNLNGRNIEKISISLFENNDLNERAISMNMFEYFFQKIRFSTDENQLLDKSLITRNKIIDNIVSRLEEKYKKNFSDYEKDRMNTWFISLEFMLFLINESKKQQKSITSLLKPMKYISYNCSDNYRTYELTREFF